MDLGSRTPTSLRIITLCVILLSPLAGLQASGLGGAEPLHIHLDETAVLVRVDNPLAEQVPFDYWIGDFVATSDVAHLWQVRYWDPDGGYQQLRGVHGMPIFALNHPLVNTSVGYEIYPMIFEDPESWEDTLQAPAGESYLLASTHHRRANFTLTTDGPLNFEIIATDPDMARIRFADVPGDWEAVTHVGILGTGLIWGHHSEIIRYGAYNFQFVGAAGLPVNQFTVLGDEGHICEANANYWGYREPPGTYRADILSVGFPNLAAHTAVWEIVDLPIDPAPGTPTSVRICM